MAISWPRPINFLVGQANHTAEHNLTNEHLNALRNEVLRGTGFPTMAAPVGTRYIDTAATSGAVEWIKVSGTGTTGWQVAYGDTGWRSVTIANTNITGSLFLRRIGDFVSFDAALNAGASAASTEQVTVPTGFKTRASRGLYGQNGAPPTKLMVTGFALGLYGLAPSQGIQVPMFTHPTTDSWPAALPGDPA